MHENVKYSPDAGGNKLSAGRDRERVTCVGDEGRASFNEHSTNMASRQSRLRTLRKRWWPIVRHKLRTFKKVQAIALVAVIAVLASVVNASTADSARTDISSVAPPLPMVTRKGVTCNTVPA